MNMMPLIVSWAVLATVVLALALYRRSVAAKEDDYLHVNAGPATEQQQVVAHKLDVIDRWGKILTVAAAVYALILGGLFMYNAWVQSSTTVQY